MSFMNMKRSLLGRRNFLWGLGSLAGAGLVMAERQTISETQALTLDISQRDFSVNGKASLKERAAAKGLIFGAYPSIAPKDLANDSNLQSALAQECNLLVMETYWGGTQPSSKAHDFSQSDFFAEFAQRHTMLLRGHPLIWHQVLPEWLSNQLASSTRSSSWIENIFVNHISQLVNRYAGKVHSWDVINEAVNPQDNRQDGLRRAPWLEALGPQYIDLAFHTASTADPQALLVYNDNEMEYDTPVCEAKRTAILKLLERLKSRGVPVGALGIQSHLSGLEHGLNPIKIRNFLKDVASLGLKILVTELDVRDNQLPANVQVRDQAVAGVYEDYLSAVLDEPAVIAVITWGITDRDSWLSYQESRPDSLPVRPLPLDEYFNRKLAWNAIARAIDSCPPRN
jgi:endo-1,4-beta-xylanase